MVVYGFCKGYKYEVDGTLRIKVRIPSIHGPFKQTNLSRLAYTRDEDLPYLDSLLLPHMPTDGEVVALLSKTDSKSSDYIVIGLTGGNYYSGSVVDNY